MEPAPLNFVKSGDAPIGDAHDMAKVVKVEDFP